MQSWLRSHALNNLASGHISGEVLLKFDCLHEPLTVSLCCHEQTNY